MDKDYKITPFEKGLIPSLDGWRAVSVFLVLFAHSQPDHEAFNQLARQVGSMGVRFFFVISGFLITWLMLREFSTRGSVNLTNFYIRRGFRILPVYVVGGFFLLANN